MQLSKLGNHDPERIVVLRALQLGDLMCTIPAFRALRAAFTTAEISLIGLPWACSFVDHFQPYIDHFIEFPGFPGFAERKPDIERLPDFLKSVQARNFDLAIQMHGSGGISNPLIMLFGAKLNAGFYLPGQYCPEKERFFAYPVHEPEVMRHLHLMEFLGFPSQGSDLEFPLYPQDWIEFQPIQIEHSLEANTYAIIHPGSRSAIRRWPVECFAKVGDGLAERGLRVVLTGSASEAKITASVRNLMKYPAIDLAGKTSLGSLGVLLSGARLLICNDTGVSHMAAAFRLPSVVLFIASDPERWAPLDHNLHRIVAWASAASPSIVMDEADCLLSQECIHNDRSEIFHSTQIQ